jgi:hypothetical protein
MTEVAQRRRGRPKGSKNKRTNLSGATVQRICEFHKFNPAEKLIAIANGTDHSDDWNKDDRFKATAKLFDAIYQKTPIPGAGLIADDEPRNYEIVFVESQDDFQLPGEACTEGVEATVRAEPI